MIIIKEEQVNVSYSPGHSQPLTYGIKETGTKVKTINSVKTTTTKHISCEMAGKYRKSKLAEDDRQRLDTQTSLSNCELRFTINLDTASDKWFLRKVTKKDSDGEFCEKHNHQPVKLVESRSGRRRALEINPTIREAITRRLMRGNKAKDIHKDILAEHPGFPITLKDIRNMGTTFKITMNKGLPAIQAMLEELGEAFHTSCYQVDDQQQLDRVIFFHRDSVDFLQRFPYCIVLDCTYKTNRFNTPLLNIVGVTLTN
jgi:hypothetical protein